MRSLILFAIVPFVMTFDNAPTLDPAIPTVSPHENATADSCVGQCAFSFVDAIRADLGATKTTSLLQLNFNDFLTSFSNVTFFENFCRIYHSFTHCSSKCQPGFLHQMLMRSSEIIDHYCVYNYEAIRSKFPCLAKVGSQKDCVHMCTSKHDSVVSLMDHFRTLAFSGDTTKAEQYLSDSCEYVTCTLHCDTPKIAHDCDFETANLVIDLTRRSFRSMEKIALDTNVVTRWPAKCADIKTYRLPTPVSPPKTDKVLAQSPQIQRTSITFEDVSTTSSISTDDVTKENRASSESLVLSTLLLFLVVVRVI